MAGKKDAVSVVNTAGTKTHQDTRRGIVENTMLRDAIRFGKMGGRHYIRLIFLPFDHIFY